MIVEQLRKAREESANVAYLTFEKHLNSDKIGLFCFFEGKDSPYYYPRITTKFSGNYYPIICSGKSKVLKVYELIDGHREYDIYKKAFFVDRDFDFPLLNPKIYETSCYSIENLYTSTNVFKEVLKSEFGFAETDDDFQRSLKVYTDLQRDFHEGITLFNAWYACLIYLRNTTNQQTGVHLEDNFPKEFINISLAGITITYDILTIKAKYPNALEIPDNVLQQKISDFNAQNKGQVFRGKYELDFMLKMINCLIEDSKTIKAFISKPIKYNTTNTQAISQFSQYAETPIELTDYIKKVIK
jgi:hypothetical protein